VVHGTFCHAPEAALDRLDRVRGREQVLHVAFGEEQGQAANSS
jgi:hypothetical protein